MKKNIFYTLSLMTIIVACLLTVTPSFAKYFGNSQGYLWNTLFTGYTDVAAEFAIDNPPHQTSNKLWGAGNEDGTLTGRDPDYLMGELTNVEFSVYNKTEANMLISFEITCYIVDDVVSEFYFFIVNTSNYPNYNSPDEQDENPQDGELLYGRFNSWNDNNHSAWNRVNMSQVVENGTVSSFDVDLWLTTLHYYKNRATINSNEILSGDELFDNFVVEPGELFTFHLRVYYTEIIGIFDNSIWSTYSTIKMVADQTDMVDPNPNTP